MFRKTTEQFWAMTLQWWTSPGHTHNSTTFGTFTPMGNPSHQDLFKEALAFARERNGIEEGVNAVVLFWHLGPNRA